MPCFNGIRCALLADDGLGAIDDLEPALLYVVNINGQKRNFTIPCWQYVEFDLDCLTDDECEIDFRFKKNDIFNLIIIFEFPQCFKTYNRINVSAVKGLTLCKNLLHVCLDIQTCFDVLQGVQFHHLVEIREFSEMTR